jgi:hypothetical protein
MDERRILIFTTNKHLSVCHTNMKSYVIRQNDDDAGRAMIENYSVGTFSLQRVGSRWDF